MLPLDDTNTDKIRKKQPSFPKGLSLVLIGICLGWFIGLSVSPVVQTILTSLIALVVSLSAVLAGLKLPDEEQTKKNKTFGILYSSLDPLPIMFLVLGLAFGTAFGIFTRTNDLLGARISPAVQEWKDTGYPPECIARRIFDSTYPPTHDKVQPVPEACAGNDQNKTVKSTPESREDNVILPSDVENERRNQSNAALSSASPSDANKYVKSLSQPITPAGHDRNTTNSYILRPNELRSNLFVKASAPDCETVMNGDREDLVNAMVSFGDNHQFDILARKFLNDPERLKKEVKKICAKLR